MAPKGPRGAKQAAEACIPPHPIQAHGESSGGAMPPLGFGKAAGSLEHLPSGNLEPPRPPGGRPGSVEAIWERGRHRSRGSNQVPKPRRTPPQSRTSCPSLPVLMPQADPMQASQHNCHTPCKKPPEPGPYGPCSKLSRRGRAWPLGLQGWFGPSPGPLAMETANMTCFRFQALLNEK